MKSQKIITYVEILNKYNQQKKTLPKGALDSFTLFKPHDLDLFKSLTKELNTDYNQFTKFVTLKDKYKEDELLLNNKI